MKKLFGLSLYIIFFAPALLLKNDPVDEVGTEPCSASSYRLTCR